MKIVFVIDLRPSTMTDDTDTSFGTTVRAFKFNGDESTFRRATVRSGWVSTEKRAQYIDA